jgi:two-component sensor histidine kinase
MVPLWRIVVGTRIYPIYARYTFTTLLVLSAALFHAAIFGNVKTYPFILFYPVIVITGGLFDRGNGIYATILSSIVVGFYTLYTHENALYTLRDNVTALLIFIASGIAAAILVEVFHSSILKLHTAREKIQSYAHMQTTLLDELSHRIRNDLSVLTSVLSLQSLTLEDPSAKEALSEAAERLQIIAKVQNKLALESTAAVVDSKEYLTDLCADLRISLLTQTAITLTTNIESHPLEHQRAVAVGLMLNELIMNAVKYAFTDRHDGIIRVQFGAATDRYVLQVEDKGSGMSQKPKPSSQKGSGLGLNLVRRLTQQLNGTLEILLSENGWSVTVAFPKDNEETIIASH